jgi:hypothetical protein
MLKSLQLWTRLLRKVENRHQRPSKSTKAVWKDDDDKLLVDTLLKEREEGHQSDSRFKSASWTACVDAVALFFRDGRTTSYFLFCWRVLVTIQVIERDVTV